MARKRLDGEVNAKIAIESSPATERERADLLELMRVHLSDRLEQTMKLLDYLGWSSRISTKVGGKCARSGTKVKSPDTIGSNVGVESCTFMQSSCFRNLVGEASGRRLFGRSRTNSELALT